MLDSCSAVFGSLGKADPNIRVRPIRERPFSLTVLEIHWLAQWTLAYTITRKSENTSRREDPEWLRVLVIIAPGMAVGLDAATDQCAADYCPESAGRFLSGRRRPQRY